MQPDRAGLSSTADAGNPSKRRGPKRYGSRHCAVFDVARRPKGRCLARWSSSREAGIPSDVSDEHVAGLLEALPTPLKSGADGLW
jgi:hypothetical protein